VNGRRIPDGSSIDDVVEPGDYLLLPSRKAIWCVLPNGVVNRIPVSETGTDSAPTWSMVEHEDGTITLSPSINLHPTPGLDEQGWHGFLERGVWRSV
jgi:hypothetical protein